MGISPICWNIKNEACIPAGLALTQTLINNIRKLTKTNLMYKSNYKCIYQMRVSDRTWAS
ncbi:hypothetical protein SAMN04487902_104282 [Prevotella sp. ne3005]|nr:hypothetical protein SAMN04487902_104282 [Prevotella sp. ne3005]